MELIYFLWWNKWSWILELGSHLLEILVYIYFLVIFTALVHFTVLQILSGFFMQFLFPHSFLNLNLLKSLESSLSFTYSQTKPLWKHHRFSRCKLKKLGKYSSQYYLTYNVCFHIKVENGNLDSGLQLAYERKLRAVWLHTLKHLLVYRPGLPFPTFWVFCVSNTEHSPNVGFCVTQNFLGFDDIFSSLRLSCLWYLFSLFFFYHYLFLLPFLLSWLYCVYLRNSWWGVCGLCGTHIFCFILCSFLTLTCITETKPVVGEQCCCFCAFDPYSRDQNWCVNWFLKVEGRMTNHSVLLRSYYCALCRAWNFCKCRNVFAVIERVFLLILLLITDCYQIHFSSLSVPTPNPTVTVLLTNTWKADGWYLSH